MSMLSLKRKTDRLTTGSPIDMVSENVRKKINRILSEKNADGYKLVRIETSDYQPLELVMCFQNPMGQYAYYTVIDEKDKKTKQS